jgi:hypothetical protein
MKRIFRIILALSLFLLFIRSNSFAQGCVAIRSTGGICTMNEHPDSANLSSYWLINSNSRYYRSFRHFVGKQEQFERINTSHNNVINKVFTQDFTLTRVLNSRWSLALNLPLADNSRSQVLKATATAPATRYTTHSFGLGDMNFSGYYWLFNPAKAPKGNIQVGLGIKFATGNYNVQDYFLTNATTGDKTLKYVDQSIQLGDGGTGITTEINAYYNFTHRFGLYGNFYHLTNPQNVSVSKSATIAPGTSLVSNTSDVFSVPDQYLVRFGASLAVNKFDFSLGVRDDCLPVHDLLGGSDGYRRPGYIIAAEPGINYRIKNIAIYGFVPIAVIRDRTQSVADRRATAAATDGSVTHGDAAFADYVVNIGLTVKF